jgi:hypothetical protein
MREKLIKYWKSKKETVKIINNEKLQYKNN